MKGVAIHALLAVIGLGLAYQTWTREDEVEERPPGEVEVLACTADQISSLEVETPTHLVRVEPAQEGDERIYWITTQRRDQKKEEAKADADKGDAGETPAAAEASQGGSESNDTAGTTASADAGVPAEPVAKPATQKRDPLAPIRFLANDAFDEYLARLTPLRAVRGLGVIPEDRFEEFGFDDVGTFWRMNCAGKKLAFDVGGRTFGVGHRYLRVPESGEVYLVEGKVVSDLQSAQFKFMQNELHGFDLLEVDEARVAAQGAERHLLHRNRRVKGEARWVDAAEPDRRNELFGNWFQRVERLKVRTYLDPGAAPGSDLEGGEVSEPEPVMTISYVTDGKAMGEVEIVRVRSMDAEFYYAKSEATHGWVSLYETAAKGVAIDIAIVAGADEMPEHLGGPSTSAPPASPGQVAPAPASPHGASPALPHGAPPTSPHGALPPTSPHGALPPGHGAH